MKRQVTALLLLLLVVAGCQRSQSAQSALPTVQMKLGSKTYTLEVAADDESKQRGLMRRDSMPADHGMIFVFADSERRSFYMKNTRIPLDIIYIGEDGKVDSIKQMKPYDEHTVWSDGPAKWAVELNQGQAAAAAVKVGDVVEIPEQARRAR